MHGRTHLMRPWVRANRAVRGFVPTDVPQSEAAALLDLYRDTNGANWTTSTNWLSTTTVDDWYGVTVADGHVTAVELPANNLVGAVNWPGLMAGLPALTTLSFNDNPSVSGDLAGMVMPSTVALFDVGYGSAFATAITVSGVFGVGAAMSFMNFEACGLTLSEIDLIAQSCVAGLGTYSGEPSLVVYEDGVDPSALDSIIALDVTWDVSYWTPE